MKRFVWLFALFVSMVFMSCESAKDGPGDPDDPSGEIPVTDPVLAPDGGPWITFDDLVMYKKRLLYELLQHERDNIFFVQDFPPPLDYVGEVGLEWAVQAKSQELREYTPDKSWPLTNSRVWFKSPEAWNRFYHLFDEGQPDAYGIDGINRVERNMRFGNEKKIYKGEHTEDGSLEIQQYISHSIMMIPAIFSSAMFSTGIFFSVGVSVLFSDSVDLSTRVNDLDINCDFLGRSPPFTESTLVKEGFYSRDSLYRNKGIVDGVEYECINILRNAESHERYVYGDRCELAVIPYWELLSQWDSGWDEVTQRYVKDRFKRVNYKVTYSRMEGYLHVHKPGYGWGVFRSGIERDYQIYVDRINNSGWGIPVDDYIKAGSPPDILNELDVPFAGPLTVTSAYVMYFPTCATVYVGKDGDTLGSVFDGDGSLWVNMLQFCYSDNGIWVEPDYSQCTVAGICFKYELGDIEGLHPIGWSIDGNNCFKNSFTGSRELYLLRYLKKL